MLGAIRRIPRVPALLGLLAFLTFAPAFWWGAPHATAPDRKLSWGTDDETPLGPLAELHNIVHPKKDRNLGYPLMYSFMAAGTYAPYLGLLWVSGDLRGLSGEYPFGLKDPVRSLKVLTGIAHLLTVFLAVGIVICTFLTGAAMGDRRIGIVAALLVTTSYPYFYYARTGNVDVPMTFFVALALTAYAHIVARGVTLKAAIVLGAGMGFALATKEACFGAFLIIPPVLVFLHYRRRPPDQSITGWPFLRPIAFTAITAILAFGFGSGLFIEPSRYFAHLEFHRELAALYESGEVAHALHDRTLRGYLALALEIAGHLADTLSWPGLLLSFFGLGLLVVRRDYGGLAVVAPGLVYLAQTAARLSISTLRQMLPVSLVLVLASGYAVVWALKRRDALRIVVPAIAVIAGLIGMLRGIDLTHAMLADSRFAAAQWLGPRLQPSDRIDHFGGTEKLPPLPVGVVTERAAPHLSFHKVAPVGPEMQAQIRERWENNPPRFIVIMPDHSSRTGPYHHTLPPPIFDALEDGSLGWDRVAFFETPPLLPWVMRPELDYRSVNPPIRIYARR